MTHQPSFTSLAAFLILVCNPIAFGANRDSLQEQFLAEASKAWAEAEKLNMNVEFEVISAANNQTDDGKHWVSRQKTKVKSRGDMLLVEETRMPAEGSNLPSAVAEEMKVQRSRVDVVNGTHCFVLRREGTNEWLVNTVKAINNNDLTIKHIRKAHRALILQPWYLADWYLPELFSSSNIHFDQVESIKEHDLSLVKVSFTYTPRGNNDTVLIRKGWVLLRPSSRWSISRGEVELESGNGERAKMKLNVDYRLNEDVVPLKTNLVLEVPKSRGFDQSTEIKNFIRHEVPEKEFSMAAYGINMVLEPPSNHFPWILLNTGVLVIVLGFILQRRFSAVSRSIK